MTESSSQCPAFSIIIPARNEEAFISGALESVQEAAAHGKISYEIIVVLNRCTDKTEEIALKFGCRVIHNDDKNLSKIRNAGAKSARGQYLVTLDADSRVAKNMFAEIVRLFSNSKIIGGGTIIIPERWSLGIALTGVFLLPVILLERLSGGLFFARREEFFAIGGFDESLLSAEDIDFARRLKRHAKQTGRRFVTLWRSYIITSCRKFDRFGDWFFIKNPMMVIKLFKGKDRRYADIVWYDFHESSLHEKSVDESSATSKVLK